MQTVNWGIIGVGDVTEKKSGPAFNKVANSKLVMVMRRDLEKARDYAQRHSVPNFSNDADELIRHPDINAVYVATPPSSHAEYTIKAAQAGKHVYVEKPMATSYDDCQKMITACEENSVKLFVAYYRRELDYFKKVKDLLLQIGEIKFLHTQLLLPPNREDYNRNNLPWRVRPEIAGAGYFYDLASHQFDFLDLLFGSITNATGQRTNQANLYDAEDIVAASFKFKSNILGTGSWCFTMPGPEKIDRTEIVGSKGTIEFSFFELQPIRAVIDGQVNEFSIKHPDNIQQPLIETVVKELLDKDKCISTGDSAARTNWVLEQIIR